MNCLKDIDDSKAELRLLQITEDGAGGMFGPWDGAKSRMYKALCTFGITTDVKGRGGSYGYGKAGLIRGSYIRCVIAYSCFPEQDDDEGVTRRLLGSIYWGAHELGSKDFTGGARLGDGRSPLTNKAADSLAMELGFEVRNPENPSEIGTTILLVDPTVLPKDIVTATERYWWPALEDDSLQFDVTVTDSSGTRYPARPRRQPELQPFIEAYEVAATKQDATREETIRKHDLKNMGKLGLIVENPGWSFPDEPKDGDSEHRSMVALLRKPRMVVEYYVPTQGGKTAPYIRGTFVADDSVNDALRRTEPAAHDSWQAKSSSGDIPQEHVKLTKELLKSIRSKISKFREDLRPSPKPTESWRLPFLDKLTQRLWSGSSKGSPPPPSAPRKFSITPGEKREETLNGNRKISGVAKIAFIDHYIDSKSDDYSEMIQVLVRYRRKEDGKLGDDIKLAVLEPSGFTSLAGETNTFRGRLKKGDEIHFEYETEEYPAWTIVGGVYVGEVIQ